MKGLKSCPFCGDKMPYIVPKTVCFSEKHCGYCGSCGAYGPLEDTVEGAVFRWNQRKHEICYNCKHRASDYCFINNNYVFLTESCEKWVGKE